VHLAYLIGERQVFIKDEAEIASGVGSAERRVFFIVSWLVVV